MIIQLSEIVKYLGSDRACDEGGELKHINKRNLRKTLKNITSSFEDFLDYFVKIIAQKCEINFQKTL